MLRDEDSSLGFGSEPDPQIAAQLAAQQYEQQSAGMNLSGNDAASDPLRVAVDQQEGLGLAPNASATAPAPSAAPQQEPSGNSFGRGLHDYAALMRGGPSYDQVQEERAAKRKQSNIDEMKAIYGALEHGVGMRQGLTGEDAAKFDETFGGQMDKLLPGMKDTYLALAKRPDMLTKFQSYAEYLPEPMQIMMKSQPKEFLKFAGTAAGMEALSGAKERFDLRIASKKLQTSMLVLHEVLPPEMWQRIKASGKPTATDMMQAQEYLPKALQLSDAQRESVQRNDKIVWNGLGVRHGAAEDAKNAAPQHLVVDGKQYAFDPQSTEGERLGTDQRYKLLGGARDPNTPNPQAKLDRETELKLADDYRQDTKGFKEVKAKFTSAKQYVAATVTDPAKITPAGDRALIFAYAKVLDPGDKVAVKDIQDIDKLSGVPSRLVQAVKNFASGKDLPNEVRQEIMTVMRREFNTLNRAQHQIEGEYKGRTERYKLDHRNVVIPHGVPLDPEDFGATPVKKTKP